MARKRKKLIVNKTDELKNQLARALADYDNLRKRVDREKDALEKIVSAKFIIRILPIFDMLEEAQKHVKDAGIAMVIEEFGKILKEEGIERIEVQKGDRFNENAHEAIEAVSGGRKGEIAEEVLSGWKFQEGPVIRPARVKVYNK